MCGHPGTALPVARSYPGTALLVARGYPGPVLSSDQRYLRTSAAARGAPAAPPGPAGGEGRGGGTGRGDRATATGTGTARPHRRSSQRGSLPSGESPPPPGTHPALTPARPAAPRSPPSAFLQPGSRNRRSLRGEEPRGATDSRQPPPPPAPRPRASLGLVVPPAAPAGRVPAAAYESQDAAGPRAPPVVRPVRALPRPGPPARVTPAEPCNRGVSRAGRVREHSQVQPSTQPCPCDPETTSPSARA